MEERKRSRSAKKGAITRHANNLDRLIAERDVPGVLEVLGLMKLAFNDLQIVHYDYHDMLKEAEQSESEVWYKEVSDTYIKVVKETKSWLDAQTPAVSPTQIAGAAKALQGDCELLHVLNLPKVEIPIFTGKSREFQGFISLFDELVDKRVSDPQVKLTRLVQYCGGVAREAIQKCIVTGGAVGYGQAREILHSRFGDPHLVAQNILKDLREGRSVLKPHELWQLADDIEVACSILHKLNMYNEIDSQQSILDILKRCHNHVKVKWRKKALNVKNVTGSYPTFEEFAQFMNRIARDCSDPLYGFHDKSFSKSVKAESCNLVMGQSSQKVHKVHTNQCLICHKGHDFKNCHKLNAMSLADKYQLFKLNRLCFNCSIPSHIARDCRQKVRCTVQGCGRKHHVLLHGSDSAPNQTSAPVNLQGSVLNNTFNTSCDQVFLPIVEVKIGQHRAVALLDSGSTHSLASRGLAERLGLCGKAVQCRLSTINSTAQVKSRMVSFDVCDSNGNNKSRINGAFVVDHIPAYSPAYKFIKDRYPHLRGIDIKPSRPCLQADLIIGMDHPHILMPLNIRRDPSNINSPYAVLTRLGWVMYGNVANGGSRRHMSINFLKVDQTGNDLQVLWELEKDEEASVAWSVHDKKVIELWDNNSSFSEGHFTVPVPWIDENVVLPDNKSMAKKRLDSNVKRLQRTDMVKIYDVNLNKMLSDGYAERVHDHDLKREDGRVWYLPHHGVTSESKPGKLRIVFDCAAQFAGISLNSLCYQGPDLTNKLLHVLLRFRQFRYAIIADIEAMYHQIRIPVKDRDCFRFLWTEHDTEVTYRMTSHLFGGVFCAASSTYALRRTVQDFECSDVARDTVSRSFYVDDLLRSVNSRGEALKVIHDTKNVLSKGGFHLAKFVANDLGLLADVDDADITQNVRDITPDYLSKALGVGWNVQDDVFLYSFRVTDNPSVITKRNILSKIASMYDPLGLLAPIIVTGRMIFQKVTRLKLSWDDPVPATIANEWLGWLRSLRDISNITFKRCVIPPEFVDGAIQLHFFCDASNLAYGSVCYVRAVSKLGKIHVSLLSSKVRLAPIKPATIPRLELCAATLAAKMEVVIRRELDVSLLPSVFWVDSQIVLAYIKNLSLRTKVFVANRVSLIHQSTDVSQWNYIPSDINAADVLSRGCTSHSMSDTWKYGPVFLHSHKSKWVDHNARMPSYSMADLELKSSSPDRLVMQATVGMSEHPLNQLIGYYSDYYRLRKALSWLLRVVKACKSKGTLDTRPITVSELGQAESMLVLHVQSMSYSSEVSDLQMGRPVDRSSSIFALSPALVDGILVVGGRLRHSRIPNDIKFPYILPSGSKLSETILRGFHQSTHLGTEWVLGKVRTKFWIPKSRNKLKQIKKHCVVCKKMYDKPMLQKKWLICHQKDVALVNQHFRMSELIALDHSMSRSEGPRSKGMGVSTLASLHELFILRFC